MHQKHARRIWGDLKKSVELGSWLRRRLTFACSPKLGQWPCGRCCTCFGADGKVSIERLCLSPYVEKPFNSKVIKSFIPELRSPKCFCVLGFLCYIWTFYEHYMYVSHIHIMGMLHSWWNLSDWILDFALRLLVINISSQREPLPHSLHTQELPFYWPNISIKCCGNLKQLI